MRFLMSLSSIISIFYRNIFYFWSQKRRAMRVLLPALCLIFGSVLLFQCKKDDDKSAAPADDNNPTTPPDVEVTITANETTVTF